MVGEASIFFDFESAWLALTAAWTLVATADLRALTAAYSDFLGEAVLALDWLLLMRRVVEVSRAAAFLSGLAAGFGAAYDFFGDSEVLA